MCFGPRAAAAGFDRSTWGTTSQSQSDRIATPETAPPHARTPPAFDRSRSRPRRTPGNRSTATGPASTITTGSATAARGRASSGRSSPATGTSALLILEPQLDPIRPRPSRPPGDPRDARRPSRPLRPAPPPGSPTRAPSGAPSPRATAAAPRSGNAARRRCFRSCPRRSVSRSTRVWPASPAPNVRSSLRLPRARPQRIVGSTRRNGRVVRSIRKKPKSVPVRGRCAAMGSPSGKTTPARYAHPERPGPTRSATSWSRLPAQWSRACGAESHAATAAIRSRVNGRVWCHACGTEGSIVDTRRSRAAHWPGTDGHLQDDARR